MCRWKRKLEGDTKKGGGELITYRPCNRLCSILSSLDETTEAQRGEITCLRPQSLWVVEPAWRPGSSHPKCSVSSPSSLLESGVFARCGSVNHRYQSPGLGMLTSTSNVTQSHLSLSMHYAPESKLKVVHRLLSFILTTVWRSRFSCFFFTGEEPETQGG